MEHSSMSSLRAYTAGLAAQDVFSHFSALTTEGCLPFQPVDSDFAGFYQTPKIELGH